MLKICKVFVVKHFPTYMIPAFLRKDLFVTIKLSLLTASKCGHALGGGGRFRGVFTGRTPFALDRRVIHGGSGEGGVHQDDI